jgi:membrane protein involved in colicin uptake
LFPPQTRQEQEREAEKRRVEAQRRAEEAERAAEAKKAKEAADREAEAKAQALNQRVEREVAVCAMAATPPPHVPVNAECTYVSTSASLATAGALAQTACRWARRSHMVLCLWR